jgi:dTDP-3-amino-2,3,6-trideoxy-4-keto-D-glucose/dTDP-3-amino-3,4,6-trideoxy-alpha-D-glucose/dTDP-2,6-dideoxy-D-kanosamine transaminase
VTDIPVWSYDREYAALRREILDAIDGAFAGGQLILGQHVRRFESSFAQWTGLGHGVGVGSGTDALALALRAVGIAAGDEVITVAFTAVPTVTAIAQTGALPVFVDVDEEGLMDPDCVERAITDRTRAIVPVHLYGQCVDMKRITAIAAASELAVIEDCAQSAGARLDDRQAGTFGAAAAHSFYPTKILGAYGDGGLVATGDPILADRVRRLRVYDATPGIGAAGVGVNSRLDEVQAAVLSVKLAYVDGWIDRRREIAGGYARRLAGTGLRLPIELDRRRHVWHLYALQHPDRDAIARELAHRGVGTGVHYPIPVHEMPAFQELAPSGGLPITERLARTVLSLPMHPWLTDAELDTVAARLREVV